MLTRAGQAGAAGRAEPVTAAASAGVIGPRPRGLPPGRAVLGGLLIAAAAVVVFAGALASGSGRSARYVVAARPLAAGTIIAPGDTATETFALPSEARGAAFRRIGTLIGRTVSVAVTPGELIQASMLTPAGGNRVLRPVSVAVDSSSLAGLTAGDPVDVLAVATSGGAGTSSPTVAPPPPDVPSPATGSGATPGSGSSAASPLGGAPAPPDGISVVVRGAALLSVSRTGSTFTPASGSDTVVTLGVSSLDEAESVVAAAHSGTVILVRAEPSDGTGPGPASAG